MIRFKIRLEIFTHLMDICRGAILLVVLNSFAILGVHAQENPIPPSQILLKDTINLGDSARKGLINKIIQPFRFHENQVRKERERMVELIRKLAVDGDMTIDSATVDAIVNELMELTNSLAATRDTTVSLQQEIDRTILNLDSKAPKHLVDSIQVQLGNVLQGLLDQSKSKNSEGKKELTAKLSQLRQIQLSCSAEGLPIFQATLGDSLQVDYQKCLRSKIRVFGFHDPSMNDEFQNYNLNYLTDIILDGYQLASTGLEANPKGLATVLDSIILTKSHNYGKFISLSVSSGSSSVINAFLTKNSSQDQFLARIRDLVKSYNLNGINLALSAVEKNDIPQFTLFISRLKQMLTGIDEKLIVTVNIPPLANTTDLRMAGAMDFEAMNPWVDFYLVQTQKLNVVNTRIPFSLSPLLSDQTNSRGSIENTVSFYTNGKIPVQKLVLTVSYQGIYWPMPDFVPGSRAEDFGVLMDYNVIQQTLVSTSNEEKGTVIGYDPEQASAYINYGGMGSLKQLWYNDAKSLADKYNWALENSLGGVAIRGLGDDDGYTELWDVLGATLTEVDSVVVSSKKLNIQPTKLSLWDYLKTYQEDAQWAGLNDVYIGDPDGKPAAVYCYFEPVLSRDSVALLAKAYQINSFWEFRSDFMRYGSSEYYSISSFQDCICLLGRWDYYSRANGIAATILFGLLLIGTIITLLGIRKYGEDWSLRGLVVGICIGIGLLGFIALFFYFFFNTHIGFIGAGSNEVTIWILILIFILGILAGLIINKLRIAKLYAQRDLP